MAILYKNNAASTLASGIASGATSLTVSTGHGARFPTVSGGDYFYVTIISAADPTVFEIVKCTARSGDVLTIVRAQESTTAAAWSANDRVEQRITAAMLSDALGERALVGGSNATGTWGISISGSAATLTTGRTIALTGDVTGTSGTFNGSANLSFATTLANSGVAAGTYTKVTVDAKGRVTTGASLASGDLPTYTGTITSGQVTTALGFTPYNATNPSGYTNNTGTVTSVSGTGTVSGLTLTGTVTGSGSLTLGGTLSLTSGQVTTALGYTPYNSSNPSAYITSSALSSYLPLSGGTISGTVSINGGSSQPLNLTTSSSGPWGFGLTRSDAGVSSKIFLHNGSGSWAWVYEHNPVFYNGGAYSPFLHSGNYSSYALPLSGGSVSGSINLTNRLNGILVNASSNASDGGSIAIQQVTGEGWTGIFADYEPYTGWGLWHDNPNNYFCFTAESATNSIRSFTVPSRSSGNRTAHEKVRIDQNSGDIRVGGSVYITTSGHLALHAGNYTSYSPSLTGSGASGTWSINVTGNAATTSQRAFSGDISSGGQGRFTGWFSGGAATGQAAEIGMSGGEGYIFVYNRDTATYGTLNVASSAASMKFSGSTINVSSGALQQGGNQVLHAGNYTSYSPSLTGSGASGTWSINITGSAGSASNSSTVGGLSVHGGTNNEANKIVRTDGNGYIQAGWINTISGNLGSGSRLNRVWCSDDQYMRYLSLAEFKMQMGLSAKNTFQRHADYTGDSNYWVGSFGGSGMGANETFHGGSGFIDLWSGTNFPPSTSHVMGFNALHYTTSSFGSTGGNAYGIQVVGQYDQGGLLFSRACSGGSFSAWRRQLDDNNYSSYALPLSGGTLTGHLALSDSRLYLRTNGDTNHYLWNAADDWEELVAYFGTGFRVQASNGSTIATFATGNTFLWSPLNTTDVINVGYNTAGSVATSARRGIDFHAADYNYWIGKRAGAWTQPLDVSFYTGIRYHAHQAYGGHRFYTGGHDSTYSMSVGDGDSNVRVYNNLYVSGASHGNDVYTTGGWFRNHTNNNGIYWSQTGWHLYPVNGNDFYVRSGSNESTLHFITSGASSLGYLHCASDAAMGFLTSGRSWRFRVDNSGNARCYNNLYLDQNYGHGHVGLYESTRYQGVFFMGDSYKMSADGTSLANMYGIGWSHPNAGGAAGNLTDHGMLIINNGSFRCAISNSIVASGNITAYSDERLKKNWRDMPDNFVERLAQVRVGRYERIDDGMQQVGVSAQSLQPLLPEAIQVSNDEIKTLSVSYGNAALAAAVELAKEIVKLRMELDELKSKLN